ncbi:MAG: DUF1351 domain-containing protein [Anaeromassilibacillus sp.]|nr:DUF1351 domain-containing protein [Anaeromassilibacillus sp.]MDY3780544.1 DUF1351 domain-containing protein [Candidatus Limousia pullorum]
MEALMQYVTIQSLPQIAESLKELKSKIEERTAIASQVVVTEENLKEIKKLRAELNKEFAAAETDRKALLKQISEPIDSFKKTYDEFVAQPYKKADSDLKSKIDTVTAALIDEKSEKLKVYFEEYASEFKVDFVKFENLPIKVTQSESMSSLKNKVNEYVNKTVEDVEAIKNLPEDEQPEVMAEYKKHLNLSVVLAEYHERKRRAAEEKKRLEERREQAQQETVRIERVMETAPVIVPAEPPKDEKVYRTTFRVCGTKSQLLKLREFLKENDIKWETAK